MVSMFADHISAQLARRVDSQIRIALQQRIGWDFSLEDVKERCVMHQFPEGHSHLYVDDVLALIMGPVTVTTDFDGETDTYRTIVTRHIGPP